MNKRIVQAAQAWVGREFNPGQQAQCANFVRQVLKEAGIELPVAAHPWDEAALRRIGEFNVGASFANSMAEGERTTVCAEGDLVFFGGTYGGYPWDVITHVGIYEGGGMIIHRPTSSRPVERAPLNQYAHFYGARRMPDVQEAQVMKVFVNSNGATVVIDGKTYKVKDLQMILKY